MNVYYKSKFTGEEIDQRLAQGTYDDAVKAGFTGTKEEFDQLTWAFGKEQQQKLSTAQQQKADDLKTESKNIVGAINEINAKTVNQDQLQSEISKLNQTIITINDGINNEIRPAIIKNTEAISQKVDKIEGKGLSTEDYTTIEKEKLAGLENYDDSELRNQLQQTETGVAKNITEIEKLKSGKQDILISGETLKTVDGQSLLGSGDIPIKYPFTAYSDNHFSSLYIDLTNYDFETFKTLLLKGVDVINYQTYFYKIYSASYSDGYYWISARDVLDWNKYISVAANSSGVTIDIKNDKYFQTSEDASLLTDNKTITGAINELKLLETEITNKQDKQDDSLQTKAKTVVGAINELQSGKLDVNNYFSKMGSSAMRPIYEACGAVWNAETGYYELNGLTDITEEEMMWIYIETFGWWNDWGPIVRYSRHARTNLRPQSYGIIFKNTDVLYPFSEGMFETINLMALWSSNPEGYVITVNNNVHIFYNCQRLKEITGKISLIQGSSLMVFYVAEKCPLLKEIRVEIHDDTDNISFCEDSPLLSYESMQYLVDNAINTQAIIVTINPTTYSYLAGTAQPTEEVGGTTEEWQALMTTAASKQISFATEE